ITVKRETPDVKFLTHIHESLFSLLGTVFINSLPNGMKRDQPQALKAQLKCRLASVGFSLVSEFLLHGDGSEEN
ncbi:hypothetical protein J6590_093352, partial [Homalodisca vitripennis]